jgi:hypothetical protein
MESEKTGMTLDDLDRPRLTESTVILYRLVGDTTTELQVLVREQVGSPP